MEKEIFISYSRRDKEPVKQITQILEKSGYSIWIDIDGINAGDEFGSLIAKAITEANVFIYFISASSTESQWTEKEISLAIELNKNIICVALDETKMKDSVKFDLINHKILPYYDNPKLCIEKLLIEVSGYIGEKKTTTLEILPLIEPEYSYKVSDEKVLYLQKSIKLAESGDVKAMCALGEHFYKRDNIKSFKYFSMAAEQGVPLAMLRSYEFNIKGVGCAKDHIKAEEWLNRLLCTNDAEAIYKAGLLIEYDVNIDFSYDQLIQCFIRVAEQSYADSMQKVEIFANFKDLLNSDEDRGFVYYLIGKAFETGDIVKANAFEALTWYKRASKCGYQHATYHLGFLYENGYLVEKSTSTALANYRMASDQGHKYASELSRTLNVTDKRENTIYRNGAYYNPKKPDELDLTQYEGLSSFLVGYKIVTIIVSIFFLFTIIGTPIYLYMHYYAYRSILHRKPEALMYIRVCSIAMLFLSFNNFVRLMGYTSCRWPFTSDEIDVLYSKEFRKSSMIDTVLCISYLIVLLSLIIFLPNTLFRLLQ